MRKSGRTKKICFIGGFSNGGTERATFLIANQLRKDYEVYLVNVDDYEPAFYIDDRIGLYHICKSESFVSHCAKIYKFLKQNKIDIVINVEADICIYTIPISIIYRKCRYIVWEHANIFQIHNLLIPYMRRFAIKNFYKYIVLTKRDENNFLRRYPNCNKLEYIYNATDLPDSNIEYDINSKTIISAGHHLPIKNFCVIPKIAQKIFGLHSDWKWEIYGKKSGETYEKLKKEICSKGLEQNVILCERTDDMCNVYKNSSVYVMTSLMEGLPMTLLEAKSYKLPIVAFNIETGPDEIVEDGVNGYLIKPYDTDEMAKKICNLIEDNALRQTFSDNAYVGIEKFNIDEVMKKWIDVIEE